MERKEDGAYAKVSCDVCKKRVRYDHCATRGSSGWALVCPKCDLPDGWTIKWSTSKRQTYYYHYKDRLVRWGHPAPGNPKFSETEVSKRAEFKKPSSEKKPSSRSLAVPPAPIRKNMHAAYKPTAPGYYGTANERRFQLDH